jgi:hypothetical protein
MGALHFPFVQAPSGIAIFPSHITIAVVPGAVEASKLDSPAFNVALRCHAPPVRCILASPPIRV